jgi:hypothetical protein
MKVHFIRVMPSHTRRVRKEIAVSQAESLRRAIENLVDAKLLDLVGKPGGLDRLIAHRRTGVASFDIRNAERRLQDVLAEALTGEATLHEQVA